tara:strand:- start:559 stop:885 length:327 start_codon:yes stop_codon:yes gene_type:complete
VKKLIINFLKFISLPIIFLSIFNQVKSDEKYNEGKIIFLENGNCAMCHTLLDAGSDANIGPNLNEIRPDIMRVIAAVTNGIGVMPAYQGELSPEEIEAVAYYVSISSE